jgi:hypothetical protein
MKSVDYEKIAYGTTGYLLNNREWVAKMPYLLQYCNATLLKNLHRLQFEFSKKYMQKPGTYINFGTGAGFLEYERPDIDTVENVKRLDHFSTLRGLLRIKKPYRMTGIQRDRWNTDITKRYDYATCIRFSPVEFSESNEQLNLYLDRIFSVADNVIIHNIANPRPAKLWIDEHEVEETDATRTFIVSRDDFRNHLLYK